MDPCFSNVKIHCEILLSDYFMKHGLMYISLHLIQFNEIHIKYVKSKPPRAIIRKMDSKESQGSNLLLIPWNYNTNRNNM